MCFFLGESTLRNLSWGAVMGAKGLPVMGHGFITIAPPCCITKKGRIQHHNDIGCMQAANGVPDTSSSIGTSQVANGVPDNSLSTLGSVLDPFP